MRIIDKYKDIIFSLSIIIIVLIISLRNIEFLKMWAFGDLITFPTDHNLMIDSILYSWKSEGIGFPNPPFINFNILALLVSYIFGSIIGQKILFLSIFIISFLSSYYFLKYFKFESKISFIGAFIYTFNPVTISSFAGGSIGELMTFAIFPFFIIFIYRLVLDNRFDMRHVSILVLLSIFIFNIYVAFWYSILSIPVLLIIFRCKIRNVFRLIIPIFLISIIFLPTFVGLISMDSGISKEEISFIPMAKYTYNDISILNIIRMAGNKGSAQNEEFLNYNTLNTYTILGYVLSFFALSSIVLLINNKIQKEVRNLILYGFISFGLGTIILLIIKNDPGLVDSSVILSSLRNPMKLIYPLVLPFVVLFCCSMNILFDKLFDILFDIFDKISRDRFKIYIISVFVIIIIFYNYPALDGTLGLKTILSQQYIVDNKYFELKDIMYRIDNRYNDSMILFLPWEYITNLRIRGEMNNYFGTNLGAQTVGIDISKFKEVFDVMTSKDSDTKYDVFTLFNVKYVVIDKTFKSDDEKFDWYRELKDNYNSLVLDSHNSYWIVGNPNYFYSIFNKDQNFKLAYEDKNFAIFRNDIEPRKFSSIFDNKFDFDVKAEYVQKSDNLVKNPSFENNSQEWTIWKKESIKLSDDSKEGNRSIILYGQDEWWSTAFQIFPVKDDVLYRLTYYEKIFNMTDAHTKILWYNQTEKLGEGDGFRSDYIDLYKENLIEGVWYKIDRIFSSPKDTKMSRIEFKGSRLIDNTTNTSIFLDGISFNEISPEITDIPYSTKIDYIRINPTLYKIKVNKTVPFILSFVESYNPSWEAIIYKDKKIINKTGAIPIYSIINGFKINDIGNISIIVRYKPQYWYEISLMASAIMLITNIIYIFHVMVVKYEKT